MVTYTHTNLPSKRHRGNAAALSLNSTEAVSSYHPRDILARMSLTYHEKIGRVGRVGRGCYEKTAPVEFQLNSLAQRARRTSPFASKTSKVNPDCSRCAAAIGDAVFYWIISYTVVAGGPIIPFCSDGWEDVLVPWRDEERWRNRRTSWRGGRIGKFLTFNKMGLVPHLHSY